MNDDASRTPVVGAPPGISPQLHDRLNLVGVEPASKHPVASVPELWLPRGSAGTGARKERQTGGISAVPDLTATSVVELAGLEVQMPAAQTFGFAVQAGTATHSGARWISPLLRHSVEFPAVWTGRVTQDARHQPSRSRVSRLLDRLCGTDPTAAPPSTVVVVAHPDDEAIGAGARVTAVPDSTIVHVTDGAPRDPGYALRKGFTSREAYALSRQAELAAALDVLGVPLERTRCLGIIDGEATEHLVEITYRLAAVFDELRPEVAVTHPYEGGHTDHDATAFAVHLACGVLRREGAVAPVIVELTSYHLYGGERRVGEFLPFGDLEERAVDLNGEAQELKQRMYDCFASQRECLAAFPRDRERFRAAPRYIFTKPPHAGPLLYEQVSSRFEGERWRDSAARALQRLRARPMAKSA